MSERMTSINLPGSPSSGYADWGRKTPAEMISTIRAWARHNLEGAQQILAAADEDFRVETYIGVHVQRNREVIQEGRDREPGARTPGQLGDRHDEPAFLAPLGDALDRMVAIQMTAYPAAWTEDERREAAEEYLFGKQEGALRC